MKTVKNQVKTFFNKPSVNWKMRMTIFYKKEKKNLKLKSIFSVQIHRVCRIIKHLGQI